jgi:outer membrane protein OmpA-like peptidoglycan-associated protein
MAVDLLGRMKDFWTSEAIQQLSLMLDEQPDRVVQALSLGAPTILAGLLNASTGTTDARRLVDVVKHEPDEMTRFGGLSGLLGHLAGLGDAVGLDPLVKYGRTALRSIFGDKLDAVIDLIATDSGAQRSAAGALLSLLAPTLMGMIRKEFGERAMTGDNLHGFLMSQRDSIAARAPGKLAETLGVRSLADLGATPAVAPAPARAHSHATTVHRTRPAAARPSAARWAIPVALGLLAVGLGYYFLPEANPPGPEGEQVRSERAAPAPVAPAPTQTAANEKRDDVTSPRTTGDGEPIRPTSMKLLSMPLPDNTTINVPEGSYLEAAVKFLRDEKAKEARTFTADALVFDQDSKLTEDAAHSAEDLARIAKAYPKAKLKIEAREAPGGPDDRDERRGTAQKRADAVRDVLVQAGVPADRVVAEVRAADSLDAGAQAPKPAVDVVVSPE